MTNVALALQNDRMRRSDATGGQPSLWQWRTTGIDLRAERGKDEGEELSSHRIHLYGLTDTGQGSARDPARHYLHLPSREGGGSLFLVWNGDVVVETFPARQFPGLEEYVAQGKLWGGQRPAPAIREWSWRAFQDEISEASTAFHEEPETENQTDLAGRNGWHLELLEACLDRLLAAAAEERFEPGIESELAEGLTLLHRRFSRRLWQSLKRRLVRPLQDIEVAAEVLRWSGRIEVTGQEHEERLGLLVLGLSHHAPIVRDGATTGIGCLNDAVALAHLQTAIEREKIRELREDMENVAASFGK
jgi:hypothetical protein